MSNTKAFQKDCDYCGHKIELSNRGGPWLPYNLDGSNHECQNGVRKNKEKEQEQGQTQTELSKQNEQKIKNGNGMLPKVKQRETWLDWFCDEYEDDSGLYPYSDNPNHDLIEMSFARNKILAAIADSLERIADVQEYMSKGNLRSVTSGD